MLCPKCNFEFSSDSGTCPTCKHPCGTSMYLDAAVKINDDSIIVDEYLKEDAAPARAQMEPRPFPGKARGLPQANPGQPRAAGTKSLAISVTVGAVLLFGFIGTGLYYLQYKASGGAALQIRSKPLMLPAPGALSPAFRTAAAEDKPSVSDPPVQLQQQASAQQPATAESDQDAAATTAEVPREEKTTISIQKDASSHSARQPALLRPKRPEPGSARTSEENFKTGSYVVLCGSFKSRQKAVSAAEKLQQKHYTAFMERTDLGARGIWYRVKIDGFESRASAEKIRDKIKREMNFDALVSRKKK